MRYAIIILLCLGLSSVLRAEEKLKFKQLFTEVPSTSLKTLKTSFSRDSINGWSLIRGSTGVLYYYDEQIYADLQKRGRDWGMGNQDNTSSVITVSGQELLRLPTDTGSFMYFLGDGWMHAGGDGDELDRLLARLAEIRKEEGDDRDDFEIHVISYDAYTLDGIKRLEDKGVTDAIVGFRVPYIMGPDTEPLEKKIDAINKYAHSIIHRVNR